MRPRSRCTARANRWLLTAKEYSILQAIAGDIDFRPPPAPHVWEPTADRDTCRQLAAQIGDLIDKVEGLLEQRNDVVHGWWRFGIDGVTAIRGRAHRKAPDLEVHQMKREDIVVLAGQLDSARHAALRYAASVATLDGSSRG
jgi:hypothetical protein